MEFLVLNSIYNKVRPVGGGDDWYWLVVDWLVGDWLVGDWYLVIDSGWLIVGDW